MYGGWPASRARYNGRNLSTLSEKWLHDTSGSSPLPALDRDSAANCYLFRLVDHTVVVTKGGPDNASSLLLYYVYEVGFKFWDSAYAAALTMVLLVLLALRAVGQFLFFDRKVHYR